MESKDFKVFLVPQAIKEVALLLPHLASLHQVVLSVEPNQVTKLKDSLADAPNKATASTTKIFPNVVL